MKRSAMRLYLSDDTPIELLRHAGEQAELLSPRAAPPGTPLQLHGGAGAPRFQIKVNRCRKANAGFCIEGRWVSLTRGDREWLQLNATAAPDRDPAS